MENQENIQEHQHNQNGALENHENLNDGNLKFFKEIFNNPANWYFLNEILDDNETKNFIPSQE